MLEARRRSSAFHAVGALLVAATIVLLILGIAASHNAGHRMIGAIGETRANVRAAFRVLEAVEAVEGGYRAYAGGAGAVYRRDYEHGVSETGIALTRLHQSASDNPELAPAVAQVTAAVEQRLAFCAEAVALRDAGRGQAAFNYMLRPDAATTQLAVRQTVFEFVDNAEASIASLTVAEQRQRNTSDQLAIALAAVAMIACALSFWSIVRERAVWGRVRGMLEQSNLALERAKADAQASDAAKTRFLAVASHDLRQPLHALSLYVSALRRRIAPSPDSDKILVNMERAITSMVQMFGALLDLARIQSGVDQPEIEDFALQDSFDRIAAEFGTERVEMPPTTLALRTDPRQFDAVLRNYVSNAMKHGGGWARIEARAENQRVTISVIDRGPGVPADKADEIFNEFSRLSATHTDGLGLGLAIVRRIAEQLGLQTAVTSSPEGGACFSVTVPQSERADFETDDDDESEVSLAGVNVVVIDDEPLALEAAAQILRDAGAQVRTGDGAPALDALLAEGAPPAMLVLDLRLDGELRGVDLANTHCARLSPPPAVLIVTGDTGAETLAMLRASGYDWLTKPVQPSEFVSAVALAASIHALRQQADRVAAPA